MLTFFHSPNTRSSTIAALIAEMGIADHLETRIVTIPRIDGSGNRDAANPHPEGKVPALVHDGRLITERAAIILHLTSLFPETSLAPRIGTPEWGVFASWLAWYQGVLEPVLIMEAAGLTHPWMTAAIRGHVEATARIHAALEKGPWLMGDTFTAADLLIHGAYAWFAEAIPDDPLFSDWVARCIARPVGQAVLAQDAALMAKLAA